MNAWYMSGAGNDFMVIDARGLSLDFSKLAQDLCKKMDCDGFRPFLGLAQLPGLSTYIPSISASKGIWV